MPIARSDENAAAAQPYPKVLVVSTSVFNPYSGTGVTLSNLFRNWPKEKLAMIHSDHNFKPDPELTDNYFKIGTQERMLLSLGKFLTKGKNKVSVSEKEGNAVGRSASTRRQNPLLRLHPGGRAYRLIARILGDLEPLAGIRISDRLKRWLRSFQPDVLYATVSTISQMRFMRRLKTLVNAPMSIHILDDWLPFQYRGGALGPLFRHTMRKEFKRIIAISDLRMGIGKAMCDEYSAAYGLPFVPFSNPVDVDKLREKPRVDCHPGSTFKVLYIGTINSKNQHSLRALSSAVHALNTCGVNVSMTIYSFQPRADIFRPVLEKKPAVTIAEVPGDNNEVLMLMQSANLLVLPLDFTEASITRMRLSFFTKTPAYMMSGVPVLVFGPEEISTVRLAREQGWAYVVPQNDKNMLKAAIAKLMNDNDLRKSLVARARKVALRDHDAKLVRERFRKEFCRLADYETR